MERVYHITARPDGQWQGGKANADMPFIVADTLEEAEEIVCELATEMGDAQVLVFDARGALLRDRVFGAHMERSTS